MPTQITLDQLLYIGTMVGFVLGLIPMILGFRKSKFKYGIIGFVLTLIAGAFLSLLGALPVAGVFIWLILQKPVETDPVKAKVVNENPSDVSVRDSEDSENS